jgi:hypothetical protein
VLDVLNAYTHWTSVYRLIRRTWELPAPSNLGVSYELESNALTTAPLALLYSFLYTVLLYSSTNLRFSLIMWRTLINYRIDILITLNFQNLRISIQEIPQYSNTNSTRTCHCSKCLQKSITTIFQVSGCSGKGVGVVRSLTNQSACNVSRDLSRDVTYDIQYSFTVMGVVCNIGVWNLISFERLCNHWPPLDDVLTDLVLSALFLATTVEKYVTLFCRVTLAHMRLVWL